jgi:hypothetical protein
VPPGGPREGALRTQPLRRGRGCKKRDRDLKVDEAPPLAEGNLQLAERPRRLAGSLQGGGRGHGPRGGLPRGELRPVSLRLLLRQVLQRLLHGGEGPEAGRPAGGGGARGGAAHPQGARLLGAGDGPGDLLAGGSARGMTSFTVTSLEAGRRPRAAVAQHRVDDVEQAVEGLRREAEVDPSEVDVVREAARALVAGHRHGLEGHREAVRGNDDRRCLRGLLQRRERAEEAADDVVSGHVGEGGVADEGLRRHARGPGQRLEGGVGGCQEGVVAELGGEVREARRPQPDPEVGELGGQRADAGLQGRIGIPQHDHVEEGPAEHEDAARAREQVREIAPGEDLPPGKAPPLPVRGKDEARRRGAHEGGDDRRAGQVGAQRLALVEAHAGGGPAIGELQDVGQEGLRLLRGPELRRADALEDAGLVVAGHEEDPLAGGRLDGLPQQQQRARPDGVVALRLQVLQHGVDRRCEHHRRRRFIDCLQKWRSGPRERSRGELSGSKKPLDVKVE